MQPELKAKWVKALRSGEYKQGRKYLSNYEEYCCLGVLACVDGHHPYDELKCGRTINDSERLSVHYCEHVGLPMCIASQLIDMNDGDDHRNPKDFAEIADWIESNESI
jgi:hypothetical protein